MFFRKNSAENPEDAGQEKEALKAGLQSEMDELDKVYRYAHEKDKKLYNAAADLWQRMNEIYEQMENGQAVSGKECKKFTEQSRNIRERISQLESNGK